MQIFRERARSIGAVTLSAFVLATAVVPTAQAALIGSDKIIGEPSIAASDREKVQQFLAREDVKAQIEAYGVSSDEAQLRVAALSDEEVSQISGKIDELPAGEGVVGVVVGAALIVFIILLVTDLLGWTSVFPFTNKGAARP